jgi:aspartyl-tRNA(Asn)/glutamyl-tRNA(Gln) amidotransferase subunit A
VDLRMAWSPDLGIAYVDPEVADVAHQAARALAQAGAVLTDATPGWESPSEAMWHALWVPTYAMQPVVWAAEGWDEDAPHDDIDANLLEIFAESKRLTLRDQARARLSRVQMWTAWSDFMDHFDVLLCPTLCTASFPLEQFAPSWLTGKSVREQVLDWLLTYPFNMLTNPAITVPAGFTADGRPVGLQIAAKHWDDGLVLRVARALEQVRPWAQHRPSFA